MRSRFARGAFVFFGLAGFAGLSAHADVTYTVPFITDHSGAFADVSKVFDRARGGVIAWWNDTRGKELGVELKAKFYDGRYDASVVASIWPGILESDKPILAYGTGGPDVSALRARLPDDKVPVVYGSPGYGFAWDDDEWIFNIRPSYVHEYSAFLQWYADANPEKQPIKVAFVSTQESPAFIDVVSGMKKYIEDKLEPKNVATVVATEWVPLNPVDLGAQINRIKQKNADVIFGNMSTALTSAIIRAEELHDTTIPTVASPWHSIWPVAKARKTFAPFEGHYVVTGLVPYMEKDGKAWSFYQTLADNYGLPEDWDPMTMVGVSHALVGVKAIEKTMERVGVENVTGEDVYETLTTTALDEGDLEGIMRGVKFSRTSSFPLSGWIKVLTVEHGEYVTADPDWVSVPEDIEKWD